MRRNNSWFNSIFKGNDKELDAQTEKKIKKNKSKKYYTISKNEQEDIEIKSLKSIINNLIVEKEKLLNEIHASKNDLEEKIEIINNFVKKMFEYEEKNNKLEEKNNKLEEKNSKLEEKVKQLEKIIAVNQKINIEELEKLRKQINLKEELNIELVKTLKEKDIIIMNLKSNASFNILPHNEKTISIIISSKDENIIFPIICKSTDNFKLVENIFYEKHPEYKNNNNTFIVNGRKINESKSLEENWIHNNSIIKIYYKK